VTGGGPLGPGPQRWRGVARVLPLIVLFVMGAGYTYRVEGRLECQARYNEVNNERSRALSEAADKERQAERAEKVARAALFTHPAILTPSADRTPADREEMRRLAVVWQQALTEEQKQQAAADAERKEHPVPPPPSEVCD
jgi:hypothetical protein